jgi:hypothetical protein
MRKRKERLPDSKKEEQGPLSTVLILAPLLALILQFLELILKICGVIN